MKKSLGKKKGACITERLSQCGSEKTEEGAWKEEAVRREGVVSNVGPAPAHLMRDVSTMCKLRGSHPGWAQSASVEEERVNHAKV